MVVLGKREVDGMGWLLVPTSSSTPWLAAAGGTAPVVVGKQVGPVSVVS
jgi:hypothetical protein